MMRGSSQPQSLSSSTSLFSLFDMVPPPPLSSSSSVDFSYPAEGYDDIDSSQPQSQQYQFAHGKRTTNVKDNPAVKRVTTTSAQRKSTEFALFDDDTSNNSSGRQTNRRKQLTSSSITTSPSPVVSSSNNESSAEYDSDYDYDFYREVVIPEGDDPAQDVAPIAQLARALNRLISIFASLDNNNDDDYDDENQQSPLSEIFRDYLAYEQCILLTEEAKHTLERSAVMPFCKYAELFIGAVDNMRSWRTLTIGKRAGLELVESTVDNIHLASLINMIINQYGHTIVDIYHMTDAFFVCCVYTTTAPSAVPLSSIVRPMDIEDIEPDGEFDQSKLAEIEHNNINNRQYTFEGYLFVQSIKSHEGDLARIKVYGGRDGTTAINGSYQMHP